jgi:zinc transport system substrate-binding protein
MFRMGAVHSLRQFSLLPLLRSLLLSSALLLSVACQQRSEPVDKRPVVAVSVAPLGYLVQRLAPELVQLMVMIPPGASPSTHEPTMRQLQLVSRASIYIKVGHPAFPFERTWLRRLLEHNRDMLVVDASQSTTRQLEDPHLWTSPQVMRRVAAEVAAALGSLLPEQAEQIAQNLQQFEADVAELDTLIRATLEDMTNRTFYVFHPAWSYFAAEYGLEQVAIEHRGSEPSPEALAQLIDRARSEGVHVIFVQPQFSRRSADLVAREIGGVVIALDPLDVDWLNNLQAVARSLRKASRL